MIAMLISLELMLNAVDINFVVFNRFLFPGQHHHCAHAGGSEYSGKLVRHLHSQKTQEHEAETALAIAIIINIFRAAKNIDVRSLNEMKF